MTTQLHTPTGTETPRHLAVIVDGNRRWAKVRGKSLTAGHTAGSAKVRELLEWCDSEGIAVVTLWLLSTDNLNRPSGELRELLGIITDLVRAIAATGRWRIHHLGEPTLLPQRLLGAIEESVAATTDVADRTANLAIGYGGREDIARAVGDLVAERQARGPGDRAVTVADIDARLAIPGQPDPDLILRTSGEQRTSGLLLWQAAYAEFYFSPVFWPDFGRSDFDAALASYARRERRYGR
jgi:short-chain Z-isoprenyl diphosphate synthase